MTPESTWESAIAEAELPPPTENAGETPAPTLETQPEAAPEPALETPAEGETAEVETTTDQVAREAETPAEQLTEEKPDDDIQEGDTEEIKALPRGAARAWARRRDRDAKVFDKYLGTEPITAVAEDLYQKSPSRYSELTRDIILNTFGMSYEDVKAKLAAPAEVSSQIDSSLADPGYDPLTDETLDPVVKAKLQKLTELEQKFPELETKITTIEQAEQQRQAEARQVKAEQIEVELLQSVLSVVPEGIKSYGLEIDPKDPPSIAGLKKLASFYLMGNVEGVFNESEDNVKAAKRAQDYARRLERENAFREEDVLKVRTRAALDKVKEKPEVAAVFDAIRQLTELQAKQIASRGLNTPPAPASSASAPLSDQGELTGDISQMWEQEIARASAAS